MLARAQWQASRHRLPYVCPACRLAIAQRHYSQPREQSHSSSQDDAVILGASKRTPNSVPNTGVLKAILKQISKLSRPPADRKRDQSAVPDDGDGKDGESGKAAEKKEPKAKANKKSIDAPTDRSRKRAPQEQIKESAGSEETEQSSQEALAWDSLRTELKNTHGFERKAGRRREKDSPSIEQKEPSTTASAHANGLIASPGTVSARRKRRAVDRYHDSPLRIRKHAAHFRIRKFVVRYNIASRVQRSLFEKQAALNKHLSSRAPLRDQKLAELKDRANAKEAPGPEQRNRTEESLAQKPYHLSGRPLKQVLLDRSRSVETAHVEKGIQEKLSARKQLKSKKAKGRTMEEKAAQNKIEAVNATKVKVLPLDVPKPPVPGLSYGLDRVLFNPGVYHLQDPRSRVYNFDPYLEKIIPAVEFNFSALNPFVTPSKDQTLHEAAGARNIKYYSSTSTMTESLKHFHYLVSQWRELTLSMLSKGFEAPGTSFTQIQQAPTSAFLRYQGYRYAIEADKSYDRETILSLVGRSMEKLLTLPKAAFEQYRRSNPGEVPEELTSQEEAYHYTVFDKILVRSQLDAHDPRIPGTGMFDIKTRAVLPIRMDIASRGGVVTGYQIKDRLGTYESFEREFFDMMRANMLKYSMQVRLGRMDGIFVAYHNIERIFGFQYVSLEDMDLVLHGQKDRILGDQELNASFSILGAVLDRAVMRFPKQSLRLHFETRQKKAPFMYIFAEPVSEEKLQRLDNATRKRKKEMAEALLNPDPSKAVETSEDLPFDEGWSDLRNMVREEVSSDDTEQEGEPHERERENEPQPLLDNETITKLENRIAELRTLINLLKEKSIWVRRNVDRNDNFDTLPVATVSGGNERHVLEIIKETEDLDRALKVLQSAHDLHQTEDEGPQQRIDAMPRQFKMMELDLRRQMMANERMMSTLGELTDDGSESKNSSEMEATTNHEVEEDTVESSEAQSGQEGGESSSSETALEANPDKNTAESATQTVASQERSASEETQEPSSEDALNPDSDFESAPTELLAFTLSIRNRVNGEYVTRPENLTAKDSWTIEYNLEAFSDDEEALSRYKDLRRRQRNAYGKVSDEAKIEGWYNSWFMQQMYDVSEKGRKWREEMDRVDEKIGVRVYGSEEASIGGKSDDGPGKERRDGGVLKRMVNGEAKGVDKYLEWLYEER